MHILIIFCNLLALVVFSYTSAILWKANNEWEDARLLNKPEPEFDWPLIIRTFLAWCISVSWFIAVFLDFMFGY